MTDEEVVLLGHALLKAMGNAATANSKRWFPELHERPGIDQIVHMALGMAGEVGEVANIVKKINRYQVIRPGQHADLAEELADVFTYLLNLATLLDIDLVTEFDRKQEICEQRWGT